MRDEESGKELKRLAEDCEWHWMWYVNSEPHIRYAKRSRGAGRGESVECNAGADSAAQLPVNRCNLRLLLHSEGCAAVQHVV